MILAALLLAAQPTQSDGFTPDEGRAVMATFQCQKRYVDSVPRRERRRGGGALIEAAIEACASEEAALHAILRTRYNAQSADRVVQLVRERTREGMLRYLRR